LQPGVRRMPRDVLHRRRVRPPGAAARLQRARHRARRGSLSPALEGRAGELPRRALGDRVRLLVTGGAGFIGSTYVRVALAARPDDEVVVLDKLTYAGRRENLADVENRITFVEGAIEDPQTAREAMDGCDAVVNFAAESHVDRSIADQNAFARTHVIGTSVLL